MEQPKVVIPFRMVFTLMSYLPGLKEKLPVYPFPENFLIDFIF